MHHQMHLCKQCISYLDWGNIVSVLVLLLPLMLEKLYGVMVSNQT